MIQMQSARISIVILQFTGLTAYMIIVLRMTIFDKVPTTISMLLAIMTLLPCFVRRLLFAESLVRSLVLAVLGDSCDESLHENAARHA